MARCATPVKDCVDKELAEDGKNKSDWTSEGNAAAVLALVGTRAGVFVVFVVVVCDAAASRVEGAGGGRGVAAVVVDGWTGFGGVCEGMCVECSVCDGTGGPAGTRSESSSSKPAADTPATPREGCV